MGPKWGPDCPAPDVWGRPGLRPELAFTSTNDPARHAPAPVGKPLAGLLIRGLGLQVPRGAHP